MVMIKLDCTRCGAKGTAAEIVGQKPHPGSQDDPQTVRLFNNDQVVSVRIDAFAVCQTCGKGIILDCLTRKGTDMTKLFDAQFKELAQVVRQYPEPAKITLVPNLPDDVAAPYLDAEECVAIRKWVPAAAMYRKVAERSLKYLDPQGKGMLNERIRKIEQAGKLPGGMISLLDSIKFLGNATMHDDADPDAAEVMQGRSFVRLFLTYAFDMPHQVRIAFERENERRAAKGLPPLPLPQSPADDVTGDA